MTMIHEANGESPWVGTKEENTQACCQNQVFIPLIFYWTLLMLQKETRIRCSFKSTPTPWALSHFVTVQPVILMFYAILLYTEIEYKSRTWLKFATSQGEWNKMLRRDQSWTFCHARKTIHKSENTTPWGKHGDGGIILWGGCSSAGKLFGYEGNMCWSKNLLEAEKYLERSPLGNTTLYKN